MNNKEIKAILQRIEISNAGDPWFGRPVLALLGETDPRHAFTPVTLSPGKPGHSAAELLWHMNTWAAFTLHRITGNKTSGPAAAEENDWRQIDPAIHTWKKGIRTFQSLHQQIIRELKKKDDSFLDEKVDYRQYNFRFLLNGLIDHTIYHAGQIAYILKLF